MDEILNFKYPDHITQDQKDIHRMARYNHLTLGLQLEMYERAMVTKIQTDNCYEPMPLPPLSI